MDVTMNNINAFYFTAKGEQSGYHVRFRVSNIPYVEINTLYHVDVSTTTTHTVTGKYCYFHLSNMAPPHFQTFAMSPRARLV